MQVSNKMRLFRAFGDANETVGLLFLLSFVLTKLQIVNLLEWIEDSYFQIPFLYIGWVAMSYIRRGKQKP